MKILIEFTEIQPNGTPKGKIVLNFDAIIDIREVTILGDIKGCRITTTELSVDDIAAATYNATASYSDSVLVWGSIADLFGRLDEAQAAQPPVGKIKKQAS